MNDILTTVLEGCASPPKVYCVLDSATPEDQRRYEQLVDYLDWLYSNHEDPEILKARSKREGLFLRWANDPRRVRCNNSAQSRGSGRKRCVEVKTRRMREIEDLVLQCLRDKEGEFVQTRVTWRHLSAHDASINKADVKAACCRLAQEGILNRKGTALQFLLPVLAIDGWVVESRDTPSEQIGRIKQFVPSEYGKQPLIEWQSGVVSVSQRDRLVPIAAKALLV